jgi:hypothetical protein
MGDMITTKAWDYLLPTERAEVKDLERLIGERESELLVLRARRMTFYKRGVNRRYVPGWTNLDWDLTPTRLGP